MSKKSKFYDIIPKENKSIRNVSISKKDMEDAWKEEGKSKKSDTHIKKNSIEKHNHQETSSVEIKKLERPITNVDDYNQDEYIEIIDHKISDDEVIEEVHILGENKEEIENEKIPALTDEENFIDYTKAGLKKKKGIFSGSYRRPVSIFVLFIIIFFVLNVFASATVVIKTSSINAPLGSGVEFDKGDGEMLQSTSTISVSIPASGTTQVDRKSVGTVVIFNNTSVSQKLKAGTRLQASNGLIYLTDKFVTVPAKKIKSGKVVFGNIAVTVKAENSGEKYNSGPKDFVIPGFNGTSKFDTIYGRSKGSLTGGYSGEVPNISQKDLSSLVAEAKDKIKEDLLLLLKKQADSRGLIINIDTLQYKVISSEARLSTDKTQAVVKIDGTVQANTLLHASLLETSMSVVGVNNDGGFKYEVNLSSSTLDLTTENDQIKASGDILLNTVVDKDNLTKTIENKTKKEALSIIQQSKGVSFVQISTFPFWNKTLPKAGRIKVLVQY